MILKMKEYNALQKSYSIIRRLQQLLYQKMIQN